MGNTSVCGRKYGYYFYQVLISKAAGKHKHETLKTPGINAATHIHEAVLLPAEKTALLNSQKK